MHAAVQVPLRIAQHRRADALAPAQAAVGQYLLDWGVCTSELDTALACEDLHVSYHSPDTRVLRTAAALVDGSSLEAAVAGGSAAQPEEPLAPGLCQLCSREMPLTEHHLFPRETHKKLLKRGLMSPADRLQKILICRPCHNTVHRTLDNERLALDYHSLDSLLQHEAIQRWVKFAAKQKTRGLQHGLKVPR